LYLLDAHGRAEKEGNACNCQLVSSAPAQPTC